jgi:ubiquinone/menaquinone biosynthesis C-methylase UbiE
MEQALNASFVDPEVVVRQSQVSKGAIVVDFGCGSGFFSFAFARAVGEEGRVYAMDILPSALEAVASRAKHLGLTNVFPQRANLERLGGTRLEDESVDWVLMKDILFQNKNKSVMLAEARRVLRISGRVFVMEWNETDQGVGPEAALRLGKQALMTLAQEVGLVFVQEFIVGDFHYGFVFERQVK